MSRQERPSNSQQESFSLLKNIEIEQENRKNKQSNYYAELRNQIEFEKQEKKRKKEEEAQKEREEEEKIRRDNEMLRQRAEMEKLQESKKKGPQETSNIPTNDKPKNRIAMSQNLPSLKNMPQREENYQNQNNYARLKTSESQKDASELPMEGYESIQELDKRQGPYSMSQLPTYVNRIENESFNFLPQRKYMDSYFQELLGEKRKFEQEANGIYELNRVFYHERARVNKIESRGLSELKKLELMLNQKGADYMASYSNVKNYDHYENDSLKKLTIPAFENSRLNQSGWRKLD